METESRKLLGTFDGAEVHHHPAVISASCNRVPTIDGHLENVWVTTEDTITPESAAREFRAFPSLELPSSPENMIEVFDAPDRPQPRLDRMVGDGMAVAAGGLESTSDGIKFNCLAHNTLRGAAGASVLNGELLLAEGYL